MKNFKCPLVIIIVSVLSIPAVYSQVSNKDEMIRKVFATLKSKNENEFVKLFPDSVTLRTLFKKVVEKMDDPAAEEELAGMFGEMQEKIREDFNKAIERGEKAGVNWASSSLATYTADSTRSEEDMFQVSKVGGVMYFKSNDKDYFLRYDDIIWFEDKGWYGISFKGIGKKGEEKDLDFKEFGDAPDSVKMDLDEPASVTPDTAYRIIEEPKAKPKTPVKKKSPTSKTQTPARKP